MDSSSARSIASLHIRWVPCGSERSPATKTRSGRTSSSSSSTIATSRADRVLPHLARLVERQVEEPRRALLEPQRPMPATASASRMIRLMSCTSSMSTSPGRLPPGIARPGSSSSVDRALRDAALAGHAGQEVEVAPDVVVEDRDVAAGHVRDGDRVPVLDQLAEDAAHRDHVVVGMGREADDRAAAAAAWTAPDLGAERVEDQAVERARRAVRATRDERWCSA